MIEYIDVIKWSLNPVTTWIGVAFFPLIILSPLWLLELADLSSKLFDPGIRSFTTIVIVLFATMVFFLSPLSHSIFPSYNIPPEEGIERSSGIKLNKKQADNIKAGEDVRLSGDCFISYKEGMTHAHLSFSEGCVSGDDAVPALAVRYWGR